MRLKALPAVVLAASLLVSGMASARPLIEDHWVEAGKTKYIVLILEGTRKRLLIVEGDGDLVEYCLIGPEGETVHCGRGYLQIEIPVTADGGDYSLRVVNDGRIAGNFRIIAV